MRSPSDRHEKNRRHQPERRAKKTPSRWVFHVMGSLLSALCTGANFYRPV
jgi:hypothetical protein